MTEVVIHVGRHLAPSRCGPDAAPRALRLFPSRPQAPSRGPEARRELVPGSGGRARQGAGSWRAGRAGSEGGRRPPGLLLSRPLSLPLRLPLGLSSAAARSGPPSRLAAGCGGAGGREESRLRLCPAARRRRRSYCCPPPPRSAAASPRAAGRERGRHRHLLELGLLRLSAWREGGRGGSRGCVSARGGGGRDFTAGAASCAGWRFVPPQQPWCEGGGSSARPATPATTAARAEEEPSARPPSPPALLRSAAAAAASYCLTAGRCSAPAGQRVAQKAPSIPSCSAGLCPEAPPARRSSQPSLRP